MRLFAISIVARSLFGFLIKFINLTFDLSFLSSSISFDFNAKKANSDPEKKAEKANKKIRIIVATITSKDKKDELC